MSSVIGFVSWVNCTKLRTVRWAQPGDLRTVPGGKPARGQIVQIPENPSAYGVQTLLGKGDVLYVLTVAPGDQLWLVGALTDDVSCEDRWRGRRNVTPMIDLTALSEALGFERGDGKRAARLQTPRVLDVRQTAILQHVEREGRCTVDAASYVAKVPKRLLRAAAAPTRPSNRKPKLAKGQLAFVNPRRFDHDAIANLDAVQQKQFIETIGLYANVRRKTALATRDACLKKIGISPAELELTLWDVIEGGRKAPRFEYWVQGAGDGTLFKYRSARSPASIGSTQHTFESLDRDDAKTSRLVAQLQAAADRTNW